MSRILHASTSILRSQSHFLVLASKIKEIARGNTLLYALSHDCPDLEKSLQTLCSTAKETLGCLSGPIPLRSKSPFFSCSVAVVSNGDCVPFGIREAGLPPTSIGRNRAYHGGKPRDDGSENMRDDMLSTIKGWKRNAKSEATRRYFPEELRGIGNSKSFVYFSDVSSAGLASALHEEFPGSIQLGFSGSSTPFVTGRPFTLVRNGKVQSSGAVGLALPFSPASTSFSCEDLVKLTPPLMVIRAEGNLIHETGDSLPARVLVKAIQEHEQGSSNDLAKNVDYYIGVRDSEFSGNAAPRLLKVIAGSPSRGSIAVEDVAAPTPGTTIEFYYRRHATPVAFNPKAIETDNCNFFIGSLVSSSDDSTHLESSLGRERGEIERSETFDNAFLAASDHGFNLSSGTLVHPISPWRCTVPSALGGLLFSK